MQAEPDHSDRFISRPRFGDTASALGLKFLYALDQHSSPICLPFRSYSETFGQVVRRYVSSMQPEHALSAQFVVEYLQSKQLIGEGKRLQTYKGDIQQGRPHFRVFPMDTHQMIQIEHELKSLIQDSTIHKPELLIPANNITVMVRKPNSQVIDVVVNRYSPLKVLRLEICRKEGLDGGEFSLIYAGKKLEEDEMTLDDLGIEKETMIMLAMVVKLGCFAPDSLISLPGGRVIPASEVKRGDLVMSLREEDWSLQEDEVVGVHKSMINLFLRVVLSDGRVIECTPNHKFRSNGRWMAFSKEKDEPRLREGDRILKGDLSTVKIVSIERANTFPIQFLHISTKNNHNFLLNGLSSHNMQVRLLNTANGEQFSVNISQSDTIGLLKLRAEAVVGVAKQQLMIVLNKIELRDNESIADYIQDIKNCHMLEVVQMAEHTIVVTRLKTKKEHRFKLDKQQQVRELKKLIQAETEVPRDHIILILNNIEMLNAQKIGEFELHKNFNRVSMVEVGEQQITVSKMMRFQLKKMLYVRVQGNDYLRLNYFSLREMRVEQFLTAFVPDARPSYAILVGPHLLRPARWIKDIQHLPVINDEVINCYVIRSYQRLALCPSLINGPEFTFPAAGLSNTTINELKGKEAGVKADLGNLQYIHTLKGKFGEGLTAFYQPIQAYSRGGSSLLLENYLQKFACSENPSQLQGFGYCSALMASLQAIPAYVGEVHRLLPGLRFREFYQKRGDTICIQSFLSTNVSPASLPPRPARNYTILHIKSLGGRAVGVVSGVKDEVIFMPLSYFYVQRVQVGADFDEAWVVQVPTPLSYDRDVFMWVDDEPDSRENRAICDLLDLSRYELVQLTSTAAAEYWMKEFGWIVKWLGKGIRVMSDMKRVEGPGGNMVDEAGINLVELFHNDLGYTTPIFIYCKNVSAARRAMQARNIAAGRIHKVTNDEFELIGFLTS